MEKKKTGRFGRVKASFGLTILVLVWLVGRQKETGHFGRVKASFGLNIYRF